MASDVVEFAHAPWRELVHEYKPDRCGSYGHIPRMSVLSIARLPSIYSYTTFAIVFA